MSRYRTESAWKRDNNSQVTPAIITTGDPLAVIYNEGFWRLSKVSPLYNLQYQTLKLKQYASKIRQALVSAVTANSSTKYVVQIEEQAYLKYIEDDASGLIINVLSTTEGSTTKSKISYSAVLLSWGISVILDNAIHLPYMLERGELKIGNVVKSTLQTMFDCNIKQFCFTQLQLLQFGVNFVDTDSSRSTDDFTLTYRAPQIDSKMQLGFSFEIGHINRIWNGIKDQVNDKSELVTLAYQILQNQIFDNILLDITMLEVHEVATPRAEVKNTGVVKMKTPEIVNCVLTVLNDITSDLYSDKSINSSASENNENIEPL